MPKKNAANSSNSTPQRTRPITDYFLRSSIPYSDSGLSLSTPSNRRSSRLADGPSQPLAARPATALSKKQKLNASNLPETPEVISRRKSLRNMVQTSANPVTSVMQTFNPPNSLSKTTLKRKSSFENEDEDAPYSIGCTSKATTPRTMRPPPGPIVTREFHNSNVSSSRIHSLKRARLSTPSTMTASELGEVVPTSHSSEQSYPARIVARDVRLVIQEVDTWRKQAALPSPDFTQETLAKGPDAMNNPISVVDGSEEQHTPVPSSPASTPPVPFEDNMLLTSGSPVVGFPLPSRVDSEVKTARIIAEIKARVEQAPLTSSPEQQRMSDIGELLDDSDDDGDDLFPLFLGKGQGEGSIRGLVHHPHLMHHSLGGSTSTSPVSSRLSALPPKRREVKAPSRLLQSLRSGQLSTKRKTSENPLDDLLKEKRKANRYGLGEHDVQRAENVIIDGEKLDWTDERAAMAAVEEQKILDQSLLDEIFFTVDENIIFDAADRDRLLGEEQGRAVGALLEGDKLRDRDEVNTTPGVEFWSHADSLGATTSTDPTHIHTPTLSPFLSKLCNMIQREDYDQATSLLNSGSLSIIPIDQDAVNFLCSLLLTVQAKHVRLYTVTYLFLADLWTNASPAPGIGFTFLAGFLLSLGADRRVFLEHDWPLRDAFLTKFDTCTRREAVEVLLDLFILSIKRRLPEQDELPNIIMILLLVALDPDSTPPIHQRITVAISSLCMPPQVCQFKIENMLFSTIFPYAKTLDLHNQTRLLSFLSSGNSPLRRAASWIAYSFLTGDNQLREIEPRELPPLVSIVETLENAEPGGTFDVNEATDYVAMGLHVKLLSIALLDINGYVALERQNKTLVTPQIASPGKEKPSNPLLYRITAAMDLLHDRITDTRAAHLDRSRAKAAIKTVGRRIHFQMLSSSRSLGKFKSRSTLLDYFS